MLAALAMAAAVAHFPAPIRGDFDHDGKPDVAAVVAGPKGGYRLIVHRGAVGHPVSIVTTFTRNELPDFLTSAKPGRWETWCGKGGGNDRDPCPRRFVRLRGDTLDFGHAESTEFVAIWTGRGFEVVQLSD
jgi:hypothetical protein